MINTHKPFRPIPVIVNISNHIYEYFLIKHIFNRASKSCIRLILHSTFLDMVTILACKRLPVPANGFMTPQDEMYEGQMVTVSCSKGHILTGSVSRTCGSNGQWNGTNPECKGTSCMFRNVISLTIYPYKVLFCCNKLL